MNNHRVNNHRFKFNYKWHNEGKEIVNTLECNEWNIEEICERFTEFLRGCGFYLERIEAIKEKENYEKE